MLLQCYSEPFFLLLLGMWLFTHFHYSWRFHLRKITPAWHNTSQCLGNWIICTKKAGVSSSTRQKYLYWIYGFTVCLQSCTNCTPLPWMYQSFLMLSLKDSTLKSQYFWLEQSCFPRYAPTQPTHYKEGKMQLQPGKQKEKTENTADRSCLSIICPLLSLLFWGAIEGFATSGVLLVSVVKRQRL